MNSEPPGLNATRHTYFGVFMVTMATLMYEILLTRIFSVTMWYHFAFMAVSVALFGMTVGAVLVYVLPKVFTPERTKLHLCLSALLFAVSTVLTFLTHLAIPFIMDLSITGLYAIALNYFVISIPFIFSGICVSLAMSRFPKEVSGLYAVDLIAAALGCFAVIWTLRVTDGPTGVVVVSSVAALGSFVFSADAFAPGLKKTARFVSLFLVLFALGHTVLVRMQSPALRILWAKGSQEEPPLYEKWNSFSRIRVTGNLFVKSRPFGWGLSAMYPEGKTINQLNMTIDATAGTTLTKFRGDPGEVDFLKYDLTNIAHYLRADASVLIIGTGGGRDVLSALVFNQREIVGVEMNKEIIATAAEEYGDFTGHLDKDPRVHVVNDEARSYIARSKRKFDIIQASMIDTWAATAAGAYVLAENSLYTVEAWKIFLDHLTEHGLLSFSRWYRNDPPAEVYRLLSLAAATLVRAGVDRPGDHLIVVRNRVIGERSGLPDGIGTLLMSRSPFSSEDIRTIRQVADRLKFEVVYAPGQPADPRLAALASGTGIGPDAAGFSLNLEPPDDDKPFFFNMLRLKDTFKTSLWAREIRGTNLKSVFVLGALLVIVVVLTLLCIVLPLVLTKNAVRLKGSAGLFVFFGGIGLGFMLIEISQMQRLIVFLGHPTFGLSVVLFSLLSSSGLGSLSTARVGIGEAAQRARADKGSLVRLALLVVVLGIFGLVTPQLTAALQEAGTPLRILVSIAMTFPIGFFMGMAFPLGMKLASIRSPKIMPWLWGLNGATSVMASVLAVVISLAWGIRATFWTGCAFYIVAVAAFGAIALAAKRLAPAPQ